MDYDLIQSSLLAEKLQVEAIDPSRFVSIKYHKTGDVKSRIINEVFAYADDHCIQRIYVTAALLISDNEKRLFQTRKSKYPLTYFFKFNGRNYDSYPDVIDDFRKRVEPAKELFPVKRNGYEAITAELCCPYRPSELAVIYSRDSKIWERVHFNTYEGALLYLSGQYTDDPELSEGMAGYVIPFIRKKDHPHTVLAYLNYNEDVVELEGQR